MSISMTATAEGMLTNISAMNQIYRDISNTAPGQLYNKSLNHMINGATIMATSSGLASKIVKSDVLRGLYVLFTKSVIEIASTGY